jgi:hypothetical protein
MHIQIDSKSPPKFIKRQNCFIKIVQVLLPKQNNYEYQFDFGWD